MQQYCETCARTKRFWILCYKLCSKHGVHNVILRISWKKYNWSVLGAWVKNDHVKPLRENMLFYWSALIISSGSEWPDDYRKQYNTMEQTSKDNKDWSSRKHPYHMGGYEHHHDYGQKCRCTTLHHRPTNGPKCFPHTFIRILALTPIDTIANVRGKVDA